jgi:hypothetical protein
MMDWQPIESAPKDKPVLVYCPGNHRSELVLLAEQVTHSRRWVIFIDGQEVVPTHWQPLPEPPK